MTVGECLLLRSLVILLIPGLNQLEILIHGLILLYLLIVCILLLYRLRSCLVVLLRWDNNWFVVKSFGRWIFPFLKGMVITLTWTSQCFVLFFTHFHYLKQSLTCPIAKIVIAVLSGLLIGFISIGGSISVKIVNLLIGWFGSNWRVYWQISTLLTTVQEVIAIVWLLFETKVWEILKIIVDCFV